jgi:hypothetical protein
VSFCLRIGSCWISCKAVEPGGSMVFVESEFVWCFQILPACIRSALWIVQGIGSVHFNQQVELNKWSIVVSWSWVNHKSSVFSILNIKCKTTKFSLLIGILPVFLHGWWLGAVHLYVNTGTRMCQWEDGCLVWTWSLWMIIPFAVHCLSLVVWLPLFS